MRRWIIYNLHTAKPIGDCLGYESRELAERVAQNYSTKNENWYVEIGVFQLVSTAKFAPKGELTRIEDPDPPESA